MLPTLGGGAFSIGWLNNIPPTESLSEIRVSLEGEVNQMKATQISFEVSESILQALNQSRDEFISQVRLLAALQLFKNHKLSFGQAAELAGMSKDRFLIELDNYNIDLIDYDPSELEKELERFQA
ncbi:MAG: UPF0175 family protein [Chloroflexi bacterium]|nr:UPF0175 family protein [Chloroflexota bacterium]